MMSLVFTVGGFYWSLEVLRTGLSRTNLKKNWITKSLVWILIPIRIQISKNLDPQHWIWPINILCVLLQYGYYIPTSNTGGMANNNFKKFIWEAVVVVVVGPHLATIFAHEVCRGISRLAHTHLLWLFSDIEQSFYLFSVNFFFIIRRCHLCLCKKYILWLLLRSNSVLHLVSLFITGSLGKRVGEIE